MVAIPHYAALEWTAQKTPSTTALLLWWTGVYCTIA
jgi:hypothetical protein